MEYGFLVKEIKQIDGIKKIVNDKLLLFSMDKLNEDKCYFKELQENGVIEKESDFGSNRWGMLDKIEKESEVFRRTYIVFKEDYEYNVKLKSFIINVLKYKAIRGDACRRIIKFIYECIQVSNNFDKNKYYDFEFYLAELDGNSKSQFYSYLCKYINYIDLYLEDEYYDLLSEYENMNFRKKTKVRKLPDFRTMVVFDSIIEDYFDNQSQCKKEKYLILLVWWRLTKIIPMRPTEFLILKKNCIREDLVSRRYYLKIDRIKTVQNLSKNNNIEILKEIEINEEIYNLINDYNNHCAFDYERKYLWSYSLYSKYKGYGGKTKEINKDFVNLGQLYEIIDDFYNEIVIDKYNMQIVSKKDYYSDIIKVGLNSNEILKIDIGDTRHFAFCSLMLQGIDPLTIAQLGGHHKINSQMHYQNHMENYINANIIELSILKFKKYIGDIQENFIEYDGKKKFLRNFGNNDSKYSIELVKDSGICFDKDFPNNCIENCKECSFFEMKKSISQYEKKEKYSYDKSEYEKKINETLEVWREVISSLVKEREYLDNNNLERLKIVTKQIRCLVQGSIDINANILENEVFFN